MHRTLHLFGSEELSPPNSAHIEVICDLDCSQTFFSLPEELPKHIDYMSCKEKEILKMFL